jgi:hypothetical protein
MSSQEQQGGWLARLRRGAKAEEGSLFSEAKSTSEITKKEQSNSSNEAKPLSEIITKVNDDDDSKHNVTLGEEDVSVMSTLDASAALCLQFAIDVNKKRMDQYDEQLESLQSDITGVRNAIDLQHGTIQKHTRDIANMPNAIVSSPAFKKAVADELAVHMAATPHQGTKRRGNASVGRPPRSVKKARASTSTPAPTMSTRQQESMQKHKDNRCPERLREAEEKRNKGMMRRGGAK